MQRLFVVAVLAVLSALSSWACGGGNAVPLENLDEELANALCAFNVRCGLAPDEVSCREAFGDPLGQLREAVKTGKTRYDAAAAAACVSSVGAQQCRLSVAFFGAPNTSCDQTFKGTLAVGASCFTSVECASIVCDTTGCDGTETCCQGTCGTAVREVALGGDCSALDAVCAFGTSCQTTGVLAQTCVALPGKGEACLRTEGCSAGLWCLGLDGQEVCTPPPSRGQDCRAAELIACDSLLDFCDPATSKCVALRAIGESCTRNRDCVQYGYCGSNRQCQLKPVAGGACVDTSCADGFECELTETTATCVPNSIPPVCT